MFKLGLQIFDEEGEVAVPVVDNVKPEDVIATPPVVEPPKVEAVVPEVPQVDVAEITRKVAEELSKVSEEKIQTMASTFEEKIKAIEANAKEKEENYAKLLEGLKDNKNVQGILEEMEKNKDIEEKAKKDKELLELAQTAQAQAKKAVEEKDVLLKQIADDKIASDLALEKQKFRNALIEEKTSKPWLAEKLDTILSDEDYEVQKNDYRTLTKFFDTEDEQEKFNAKKKAGSSAFDGVRVSSGKEKKEGIVDFGANYLNKLLGKGQ